MYTAICIMLCGLAAGRLTRNVPALGHLSRLILPAILLLLFLLGAAIGGNRQIMSSLPTLGLTALLLAVCGMAGSIFGVRILAFLGNKKCWRGKNGK